MATASLPLSLSLPPYSSMFGTKSNCFRNACSSYLSIRSHVPLLSNLSSRRIIIHYQNPAQAIPSTSTRNWRISSVSDNILLSEANPVENSQQIVSTNDEGTSYVVSALLLVAFAALSILTIGVIYIAATDFLRKRERDKFEKEEAAKAKKKGKKGVVKARAKAGPRGFGQKIDDDDE